MSGTSMWTKAIRFSLRSRLPFVVIMGCLLVFSTVVAGYTCWYETLACPAKCTIYYEKGGDAGRWMVINLGIILFSYLLVFLQLMEQSHNPMFLRFRLFFSKRLSAKPRRRSFMEQTGRILCLIICLLWIILTSELFAILQLLIWYILGSYALLAERALGHRVMSLEEAAAENRLGFGQLVHSLFDSYTYHSGKSVEKTAGECCCSGCEWHI